MHEYKLLNYLPALDFSAIPGTSLIFVSFEQLETSPAFKIILTLASIHPIILKDAYNSCCELVTQKKYPDIKSPCLR